MAANHDTLVGKRLDSWKEIASFLGRAERTVKRWETERGLPVHRIPGGGRSAVFAYSNELADWLKGRTEDLDEDSSGEVENLKSDFVAAPTPSAAPAPAVPQAVKNWPLPRIAAWIVPLLLAAGLITYLSADHTGSPVKVIASRQPASPEANNLSIGPDSVAVLPFTNVRGNAGTDYLSDGITESLIGSLARIPQLKVRSRDSVFRYKGKDVEVRTAGADLGVSAVVSGRVTLQGDAVEVSAELTDVLDNTEIWGHRYTGKASNLIALQQQIAGDIAGELRSKLSRSERQQVIRQGTEDPEAYNLYLKGRYAWNQRNFSNLNASIPYFNQAIAKDPQYALAYSALADVYAALPYFGDNPSEVFPK
ncbi:MAG TPA: hypothetical protein VMD76_05990, partial [Candidatus Sulfotelmatobacter sp.]|nr:hypothetical protein [Candidatus Sulfotelmatobacter sp.]